MRKISNKAIASFLSLTIPAILFSGILGYWVLTSAAITNFNEALAILTFTVSLYSMLIFEYRMLLKFNPIGTGQVIPGSKTETVYFIHSLYIILFFQPVLHMHILPTPMLRLFYQALGVRFGENSYVNGLLIDYTMIEIGDNTLLGVNTLAYCHALEGTSLTHHPIKIGSGVTVGANATILPGVIIEDDAIVAACSLVKKGTHIKKGEIWGGVPAKFIKHKDMPPKTPNFEPALTNELNM